MFVVRAVGAVVLALALGIGLLEWTPVVAVSVFAVVLCVVAGGVALVEERRPGRFRAGLVWRRSMVVTSSVVAWWAVASFSLPVALLVLVLAALAAATALRRHRPAPASPAPASPAPAPPVSATQLVRRPAEHPSSTPPEPFPFESLDDRSLCIVWRESYWDLRDQTSCEALLRVVRLRQRCLDELERRDPAALRAWLEHGARASGGPEKYWRRPGAGSADAA
jgi:hypothetical protein